MNKKYRKRRFVGVLVIVIGIAYAMFQSPDYWQQHGADKQAAEQNISSAASDALAKLPIKGRAPKTNYSRIQFGDGWKITNGCDIRNIILNRDLRDTAISDTCKVLRGTLDDPYTGKTIEFLRGANTSANVQIDHVVALSDAWQKGAQQLSKEQRVELANDPLELLAVDGKANQEKSDGDAASWLPSNKSFRCQYIARQIAVKIKYSLWVTQAEHNAMQNVLSKCPGQKLPNP